MPIIKGAKKALRGSNRKRVFNVRRKNTMNDAVKQVRKLVTEGKKEEATKMLPAVYQAIDKATKRGIIKKNNADRKKSRIVAAIKK